MRKRIVVQAKGREEEKDIEKGIGRRGRKGTEGEGRAGQSVSRERK